MKGDIKTMCGRFALVEEPETVEEAFGLDAVEEFPPRYNIAPTQPILIITAGPGREPGSNLPDRQALLVRWGFLPGWVKEPDKFPLLINARVESAATKASFKAAMRHRRILVPASGFYEWKGTGRKNAQPYWVRPKNGGLVAFGGLMETWMEPGGTEIDTAAILTCAANSQISHIHARMPVVVRPEHYSRWLDCMGSEPRDVADIAQPIEPGFFETIPVSNLVNKVANVGPELHHPVEISAEEAPAINGVDMAKSDQLSLF